MTDFDSPAGGTLLHYNLMHKLSDGLTGAVWRAEDTKKQQPVAIKMLGGDIQVNRNEIQQRVKDLQGLNHPAVGSTLEVASSGTVHFVVREFVIGDPLTTVIGDRAVDRTKLFHLGTQIVGALAYLHSRRIVHGNLRADNIIVNPRTGRIKLVGLGMSKAANSRAQEGPGRFGHLTVREVAYLAPEQILERPSSPATDIFAVGVVLYQMATGKLPFLGSTSTDVMSKILKEQPPNPAGINPAVNAGIIAVLGKCLYKDPAKRYPSADKLLEEMKREAGMLGIEDTETKGLRGEIGLANARKATVIVSLIDSYARLSKEDPEKAVRIVSAMQQLLGEAVYLFDGKVVDPFAPNLVAEFPDAARAIEAVKKGKIDIDQHNRAQGPAGDQIDIKLIVHSGTVGDGDSALVGPAIDLATGALSMVRPLQIQVSEQAMVQGNQSIGTKASVIFSGTKFFEMRVQEPVIKKKKEEASPVELEDLAPPKKKSAAVPIAIGIVVLAALGAAGWIMMGKKDPAPRPVFAAPPKPVAEAPKGPATVALTPFTIESTDLTAAAKATSIRLGVIEALSHVKDIRVSEVPASPESSFSAKVRDGATGVELVPVQGTVEGPPVALNDVGLSTRSLLGWILEQTKVSQPNPLSEIPAAVAHFVDAVAALRAGETPNRAKAVTSIRASVREDPDFLAAQRLAVGLFEEAGDRKSAIDSATRITQLDPKDLENIRQLARWNLQAGNPDTALFNYRLILLGQPSDHEALTAIGRFALAVNDAATFRKVLNRLSGLPAGTSVLHDPDLLLVAGRIDTASAKYFDAEAADPQNPALALKVGRVAVMRRSIPITELEIEKLAKQNQGFAVDVLKAYLAAEKQDREAVKVALAEAEKLASVESDFHTMAAEVYSLLGDAPQAIAHLQKAVARGESSLAYIKTSPLFRFLDNEPDFESLKMRIAELQQSITSGLASLPL